MAFALGWTGKNFDRDGSAERDAIEAAQAFANNNGMSDAELSRCYAAFAADADGADSLNWSNLEWFAMERAFDGWAEMPENVSLVWR